MLAQTEPRGFCRWEQSGGRGSQQLTVRGAGSSVSAGPEGEREPEESETRTADPATHGSFGWCSEHSGGGAPFVGGG